MKFWQDKRVVITGGAGFLGQSVVSLLKERGCRKMFIPRSKKYDLRKLSAIKRLLKDTKPNFIIHLSANVGGIGANQQRPGEFFYDNLIMGVQLIEEARVYGIKKFVAIGTICAYPKYAKVPFKEDDLWNGYPEETNAPYGLSKKMLLVQSQAYRQQYNFNSIYMLPVNLYGPKDNFSPKVSHVIPAIIKKCYDAKLKGKKSITVWGTGRISREFIYVDDAARGIVMASEKYNKPHPVNIGTGDDIKIRDLVNKIVELTHYEGKIIWDHSMPDGQPKRRLDTNRAKKEFGFTARTKLEDGLKQTIAWYKRSIGYKGV